MPLVYIVLLVVVIAAIWIVFRARAQRAPAPLGAGYVTQSAPSGFATGNVEEALALLATCVKPRGTSNLNAVVQLRISDHVPADWQFALAGGTCALSSGQDIGARLTLTANSQTWSELASKRLGFAQAAMKGTIRSEGDTSILMRLDDEFSGQPDPSRLAAITSSASSPAISTEDTAAASSVIGQANPIFGAIQAARADPNLSSDERRAAMVDALRKSIGSGAGIGMAEGASTGTPAGGMHSARDVREAVQQALNELPPGATREQKVAAMRAAIQTVPNAGHLTAMVDRLGSGAGAGSHEGLGSGIAGALLEGILGNLLDGN